MLQSPFKFLDSYTREDRKIFFGRDREITELKMGTVAAKFPKFQRNVVLQQRAFQLHRNQQILVSYEGGPCTIFRHKK